MSANSGTPMPGEGTLDARFLTYESRVLRGVRRTVSVTQPAAGANWSILVPGGRLWRLIGGNASFLASGAVANRNLGLNIRTSGIPMNITFNSTNVTNGQSVGASYTPSLTPIVSGIINVSLPVPFVPMWLEAGDELRSITGAIDVADQYSAIVLWIEEAFFSNQELPLALNYAELEALT